MLAPLPIIIRASVDELLLVSEDHQSSARDLSYSMSTSLLTDHRYANRNGTNLQGKLVSSIRV